MGAVLRVPYEVVRKGLWTKKLRSLQEGGALVVALHTGQGSVERGEEVLGMMQAKGCSGIVLVMGAEGRGVGPDTLGIVDAVWLLPMSKAVDSFSVSAAAAIAVHEMVVTLAAATVQ
jgi:tRNA G18 (ribose-2'-O)-methylase SpoU